MELQDLQETADLAHLNMEQEELRSAFGAFEEMLTFFALMQAADNDTAFAAALSGHAEGAAASARMVNAGFFRPDAPNADGAKIEAEALLARSGERDGRFIVIPNVL